MAAEYDIPLTVGIVDETAKGIAGVVAAIKGFETGLDSLYQYSEFLRKNRVFQMMGGDMDVLRKASRYVVDDWKIMIAYQQLASRNMSRYAKEFMTIAGRLQEVGLEPADIMRAVAGGRISKFRQWMPSGAVEAMKKAKTEVERMNILLKAFEGESLKAASSNNVLVDVIERLETRLHNFVIGPLWQGTKMLGAFATSALGLGYIMGKAIPMMFNTLMLKIKAINYLLTSKSKGSLIDAFSMYSRLIFGLPLKLLGIAGAFLVLRGAIKSMGLENAIKLIPEFIGGFDMSENKFRLMPKFIDKMKVAPNFFRTLGKAIIWTNGAVRGFINTFEYMGAKLAPIIGMIGSLFSDQKKGEGVFGSGMTTGSTVAGMVIIGYIVKFSNLIRVTWLLKKALIGLGLGFKGLYGKMNIIGPFLTSLPSKFIGLAAAINGFGLVAMPILGPVGLFVAAAVSIALVVKEVDGLAGAFKNLGQTVMDVFSGKFMTYLGLFGEMFANDWGGVKFEPVSSGRGTAARPSNEMEESINKQIQRNIIRAKENRPTENIINVYVDGEKRRTQQKTVGAK